MVVPKAALGGDESGSAEDPIPPWKADRSQWKNDRGWKSESSWNDGGWDEGGDDPDPRETGGPFDFKDLCKSLIAIGKMKPEQLENSESEITRCYGMLWHKELSGFLWKLDKKAVQRSMFQNGLNSSFSVFDSTQQDEILERFSALGFECGKNSNRRGSRDDKGSSSKGKDRKGSGKGKDGKDGKGKGKKDRKGKKRKWDDELHHEEDGKTGANTIEVNWKPPGKEDEGDEEMDEEDENWDGEHEYSAARDQEEADAEAARKAPAGRGRGTAMPAWMTAGVGQSSTAVVDSAPSIPEEEAAAAAAEQPDLLADIFDERDSAECVDGYQQKKGKGKSKGKKGKDKGKKGKEDKWEKKDSWNDNSNWKDKEAKESKDSWNDNSTWKDKASWKDKDSWKEGGSWKWQDSQQEEDPNEAGTMPWSSNSQEDVGGDVQMVDPEEEMRAAIASGDPDLLMRAFEKQQNGGSQEQVAQLLQAQPKHSPQQAAVSKATALSTATAKGQAPAKADMMSFGKASMTVPPTNTVFPKGMVPPTKAVFPKGMVPPTNKLVIPKGAGMGMVKPKFPGGEGAPPGLAQDRPSVGAAMDSFAAKYAAAMKQKQQNVEASGAMNDPPGMNHGQAAAMQGDGGSLTKAAGLALGKLGGMMRSPPPQPKSMGGAGEASSLSSSAAAMPFSSGQHGGEAAPGMLSGMIPGMNAGLLAEAKKMMMAQQKQKEEAEAERRQQEEAAAIARAQTQVRPAAKAADGRDLLFDGGRFTGKVLAWNDNGGWVKPDTPLDHPALVATQGALCCYLRDVEGTPVEEGALISFQAGLNPDGTVGAISARRTDKVAPAAAAPQSAQIMEAMMRQPGMADILKNPAAMAKAMASVAAQQKSGPMGALAALMQQQVTGQQEVQPQQQEAQPQQPQQPQQQESSAASSAYARALELMKAQQGASASMEARSPGAPMSAAELLAKATANAAAAPKPAPTAFEEAGLAPQAAAKSSQTMLSPLEFMKQQQQNYQKELLAKQQAMAAAMAPNPQNKMQQAMAAAMAKRVA